MQQLKRRGFLLGAVGVAGAVASPWASVAGAATDDDLAYANFGLASSYLLADFYGRALEADRLGTAARRSLRAGRAAANQHVRALTALPTDAGDTPAAAEDFAFEWPQGTFTTARRTRATGVAVLRATSRAYQRATATSTEPTYRVLFASLAASLAEQAGVLAAQGGATVAPFPAGLDLEAASGALEGYLG